ncbi:MAG: rod shape-determining protein MreC [Prevotella sp.]|nr:rod shape-determining protein MreC [Prevotella sp.]
MHNLLEFLSRYKHWMLFVILEVASFVMLFQYNNYQGSVWFTSANYLTGKVLAIGSEVQSYFNLTTVNRQLTERNVYLEQRVRMLDDRLRKAVGDSAIKAFSQPDSIPRLISAKVIENSISKTDNFITLDKGTSDGVHPDMGVISGTGVVGIVYMASSNFSVVIPVLNSKSNISCSIAGRDYFGYLHWDGGSPQIAYLEDIPRHARFRLHDKIVTSGYSSVFPKGVMVGEILHVFNSSDGLSYRIQLRLSTDFSRLRDVCVIDDVQMLEQRKLMKAASDSIKARD